MLNSLQKLVWRQDVTQQQEELNKRAEQSRATFVEPQSLAEIQAEEEIERIARMNHGEV